MLALVLIVYSDKLYIENISKIRKQVNVDKV